MVKTSGPKAAAPEIALLCANIAYNAGCIDAAGVEGLKTALENADMFGKTGRSMSEAVKAGEAIHHHTIGQAQEIKGHAPHEVSRSKTPAEVAQNRTKGGHGLS